MVREKIKKNYGKIKNHERVEKLTISKSRIKAMIFASLHLRGIEEPKVLQKSDISSEF